MRADLFALTCFVGVGPHKTLVRGYGVLQGLNPLCFPASSRGNPPFNTLWPVPCRTYTQEPPIVTCHVLGLPLGVAQWRLGQGVLPE